MSSVVSLIVVGKLKDKNLEIIENEYLKRIKDPVLNIYEVKAMALNKEAETKEILKEAVKISKGKDYHLVLLAETGHEFDSKKFSSWLSTKLETFSNLIFVIAGAEGHSDEILKLAHDKLSLSRLTFPHKIARILFVEQFYRAQTLRIGHPYHN